jgi:hypothetical protein
MSLKYFNAKIYENSNDKTFLIYAWLPLEVEIFNNARGLSIVYYFILNFYHVLYTVEILEQQMSCLLNMP